MPYTQKHQVRSIFPGKDELSSFLIAFNMLLCRRKNIFKDQNYQDSFELKDDVILVRPRVDADFVSNGTDKIAYRVVLT